MLVEANEEQVVYLEEEAEWERQARSLVTQIDVFEELLGEAAGSDEESGSELSVEEIVAMKKDGHAKVPELQLERASQHSRNETQRSKKDSSRARLLGQARKSLLLPGENTLASELQTLGHDPIFIQDAVLDALKQLYHDVRSCSAVPHMAAVLGKFLKDVRKHGVTIHTKLIEVIHAVLTRNADAFDDINQHLKDKVQVLEKEIDHLTQQLQKKEEASNGKTLTPTPPF